jgi:AraC family ethanolamine operon transcriptional activator
VPNVIDDARGSAGWQVHFGMSHDIDVHAARLQRWRQDYDQLTAGTFSGRLDQVWSDVAQVFRERSNQALRQRCEVWTDALWCGVTSVRDGSRINGREVAEHSVMVCGQAGHFELVSPAGHDILGIVVSRQALTSHAEVLGMRLPWPVLDRSSWLQVDPQRRRDAQARMRAILALAEGACEAHRHAQAARTSLHRAILDVLTELFEAPMEPLVDRSNATSRRRLVRQVDEWLLAHPDTVPSVPDLCEQLHVSRRTLQYAFESAVAMSPKAYLRSIRLNGVRRALRRAAPGTLSVQEAAAEWGFWNLSQFSHDYRHHFGERPSATLNQI